MTRKKQRQFTAQFKLETVMEVLKGEKPIAQIGREREVTDSLVYKWRGEFLDKALGSFEGRVTSSQTNESGERIAELDRLVGQLTMENALLKKGTSWLEAARRKNGQ
jgi:transposase-like protein